MAFEGLVEHTKRCKSEAGRRGYPLLRNWKRDGRSDDYEDERLPLNVVKFKEVSMMSKLLQFGSFED